MQTITLPYDPAEDLVDERDQAALLEEAFASGDAKFITVALGAVARARGMSAVAEQTGRIRTSLYKALSEDGDPQLSTLLSVVAALGFSLTLTPATLDEPKSVKLPPGFTLPSGARLRKMALMGLATADAQEQIRLRQEHRRRQPNPAPKEPSKP